MKPEDNRKENLILSPITGKILNNPPIRTTAVGIISSIVLITIIGCWFMFHNSLKFNGVQSVVTITDTRVLEDNRAYIYYRLNTKKGSIELNKIYDNLDKEEVGRLINKSFVIFYLPNNVDKNQLLISKQDFDDFGLTQPDSVKQFSNIFDK